MVSDTQVSLFCLALTYDQVIGGGGRERGRAIFFAQFRGESPRSGLIRRSVGERKLP